MPKFSAASGSKLATTHPLLQELCRRIVAHRDITILCGHRAEAEQNAALASGKSTKPFPSSKHNLLPAMAVDIAPWPLPDNWGGLTEKTNAARDLEWKERVKFYEAIAIAKFCWSQMLDDFPELAQHWQLRCGADWDGDNDYRDNTFDDLPHIELVELHP